MQNDAMNSSKNTFNQPIGNDPILCFEPGNCKASEGLQLHDLTLFICNWQ